MCDAATVFLVYVFLAVTDRLAFLPPSSAAHTTTAKQKSTNKTILMNDDATNWCVLLLGLTRHRPREQSINPTTTIPNFGEATAATTTTIPYCGWFDAIGSGSGGGDGLSDRR